MTQSRPTEMRATQLPPPDSDYAVELADSNRDNLLTTLAQTSSASFPLCLKCLGG